MMDSPGSDETGALKNWRQSDNGKPSSSGTKSGANVLLEIDKEG
jgi:hypothetical protein